MNAETPSPSSSPDWRELLSNVVREGRRVVENEANAARTEWRQRNRLTAETVGFVVVAGLCALMALAFLGTALVAVLDALVPLWLAALIVGGLWGVGAGIVGRTAYARFQHEEAAGDQSDPRV